MLRELQRSRRILKGAVCAFLVVGIAVVPWAGAQKEKPLEVVVRGTVQRAATVEGGGWVMRLDRHLQMHGKDVGEIAIEGKPGQADKYLGKYVEARAAIETKAGSGQESQPVLKLRSLRGADADGKAEAALGYVTIKLDITPAVVDLKVKAGKPRETGPLVSFGMRNESLQILNFEFKNAGEICYSVCAVETGELTWLYPSEQIQTPSRIELKGYQSILRFIELPMQSIPRAGAYAVGASLCGYEEYALSARFVVR